MGYLKHYMTTLPKNTLLMGCLGLGIALLFLGGRAIHHFYFVGYPIAVEATVLESFETITTNSGGRTNRSYHIEYAYKYKGRAYRSRRYRYSHSTPKEALRLQPGDVVDAYINPDDPGDSVIVNEITWTNIVGSTLGLCLILASLVMHGRLLHNMKR